MIRIITAKRLKELETKVSYNALVAHAYKTRLRWERNLDLTEDHSSPPVPSPWAVKK